MASLLPLGFLTFLDANGNPLSSGTVGYYDPSTAGLLKTVWADSTQNTPLQNPVPLDAAGRPFSGGSEVGVYGTGQYQMIVHNASGVLQWSALTAEPLSTTGGTVSGNFTVNSLLTALNVQINGNLTVAGNTNLQAVSFTGGTGQFTNLTVTNNLGVTGAATIGGTLGVTGKVTTGADLDVFGNLGVTGTSTLNGQVNIIADLVLGHDESAVVGSMFAENFTASIAMFSPVFNVTSDRRTKTATRAQPSNLLDNVSAVPIWQGHYNDRPDTIQPLVFADELQRHCPWLVTGEAGAVKADGRPDLQRVDLWGMVVALLGAVQELSKRLIVVEAQPAREA